ncbi:28052_t:CDS:2 [Dentiscutata erythropus]|uniref:28052_t:CDS:1 n=1 Tax=Dentiscutata erythropus TaxID=1348616 RepID=A0A9N9F6D7_9GLOM|nr:28052_t:CDS:2 [Dentiscutata erythropus]
MADLEFKSQEEWLKDIILNDIFFELELEIYFELELVIHLGLELEIYLGLVLEICL